MAPDGACRAALQFLNPGADVERDAPLWALFSPYERLPGVGSFPVRHQPAMKLSWWYRRWRDGREASRGTSASWRDRDRGQVLAMHDCIRYRSVAKLANVQHEEFSMSAGIASVYEAKPGRTQDLTAVLLEAAEYMGSTGGSAQVRGSWLAGENANTYSLITQYPSVEAQMEGFDRVIADVANNPLGGAFGQEDSPATLRSRYTFATLNPDAQIADPPPVMGVMVYQVAPSAREAAEATFAAVEERHASIGFATRAIRILNAGPLSLSVAYLIPAANYAEFGTFLPKNAELGVPGPLAEATASGSITLISQSSTILVTS